MNSQGLVVLAAQLEKDSQSEAQILYWSADSGFQTAVDKNSTFPGPHSGSPEFFTHLTLTEEGSFSFITSFAGQSGIYVYAKDHIEKIVADGDPTPLGGGFYLRLNLLLIPGPPLPNSVWFDAVATRELDIAFTANVLGTDQYRAAFLWSGGLLAAIPAKDQVIEGVDSLVVESLQIADLVTGPRLLLDATCYSNWTSALVSAVPAQPRISFLPLVAWGNAGSLGYDTQLSLTNHSRFAGNVALEWFLRSGQQLHGTGFPELISLDPGQVLRLHPSPYDLPIPTPAVVPMQTGYVKLTVEGGARISADAALELRDGASAISRANIAATQPSRLADVSVDAGTGKTAVAVTNSSSSPVRAVIQLLDEGGHAVGLETIDLAARRQSNFMLEDFFGTLPTGFKGRLRVQSNAPVLTASLRLHGVESSSLPVFQDPQYRVRKWGYQNVCPKSPAQSILSPAGTFAYVADSKLLVLKAGRLYSPLESEEAQSKIWPGSYAQLIGFWRDDELLFEARQSTGTTAIFSWKPGRLEKLFGVPEGLPGGQEFEVASFNEGNGQEGFAIGIGKDELFLLGSERSPDNSTQLVFYRYDGQLHRSAVLSTSATSLSFPTLQDFECRAPYVAFVVGSGSYSQLWLYSDGELRMLTDTENSAPQYSRVLSFRDIELTSYGQVFFTGELESRMTLERSGGLFRFEEGRVTPVLMRGDPIAGLPGIAVDSFDIYSSSRVFDINANDRVVIKTHASPGGMVFLEAADTTAAPALLFPTAEAFQAGERQNILEFEWTDDDTLVFVAFATRQQSLRVWRDGRVETILSDTEPLGTFRNQPPSVVDSFRRVWASSSGHIFFDAHTGGGEPDGIWQVLPGNARSYIFPTAPDIDENGIKYGSSITLQNRDQQESRVRLTLVTTDGREAASEEMVLAPGETRTVATEQGGFSGWARVTVQGGDTMVTERLTLDLDGHFSQLHLAAATPLREVYLPSTPGWSSDSSTDLIGIAIANPYSGAPDVFIERIGEGFEVVEQVMIVIPPRGQRAFYISDLLPEHPEVKTIRIRSTWPVAVTALNWSQLGICLQPVF